MAPAATHTFFYMAVKDRRRRGERPAMFLWRRQQKARLITAVQVADMLPIAGQHCPELAGAIGIRTLTMRSLPLGCAEEAPGPGH